VLKNISPKDAAKEISGARGATIYLL
jgi:hypothetical protein